MCGNYRVYHQCQGIQKHRLVQLSVRCPYSPKPHTLNRILPTPVSTNYGLPGPYKFFLLMEECLKHESEEPTRNCGARSMQGPGVGERIRRTMLRVYGDEGGRCNSKVQAFGRLQNKQNTLGCC